MNLLHRKKEGFIAVTVASNTWPRRIAWYGFWTIIVIVAAAFLTLSVFAPGIGNPQNVGVSAPGPFTGGLYIVDASVVVILLFFAWKGFSKWRHGLRSKMFFMTARVPEGTYNGWIPTGDGIPRHTLPVEEYVALKVKTGKSILPEEAFKAG